MFEPTREMKRLVAKYDLLLMTLENKKAVKDGRYKVIAEEIKKELHDAADMEGTFKGIIDLQEEKIARLEERLKEQGVDRRKAVPKVPCIVHLIRKTDPHVNA